MRQEPNPQDPQTSGERFWSNIADEYEREQYRVVTNYPSLWMRHRYILDMFDADGKTVLDIGCGPGEMLRELLDRECTVYGMDISQAMIDLARHNTLEHPKRDNLDLRVGDIESLPYGEATFDAVICAGVVEYLEHDTRSLAELNRVLKPGGTLIISVRNRLCPARLIDTVGDAMKQSRWGMALLSAAKRRIVRNPNARIHFTLYRKHYPWLFRRHLRHAGFEPADYRYFHFYPFFVPFDQLAPALFVRAGLKMERLSRTALGWLGSGYIVKARRTRPLGGAPPPGESTD